MAKHLAEKRQTTMTEVVRQAIREPYEQLMETKRNADETAINKGVTEDIAEPVLVGENDPRVQQVMKIVRRNREIAPKMLGSQDIDEYLYDKDGLPK